MAEEQRRGDSRVGVAYAGIAVGGLAVLCLTAVGLRWLARPPVRRITVGRGGLTYQGARRRPR